MSTTSEPVEHAMTCPAFDNDASPCECPPPRDVVLEEYILDEKRRQRARATARRDLERETRPGGSREWLTGETFVANGPAESPMRVEELLPQGGVVVMTAQAKSGKTTLELELARCLITGDDFLGRFAVTPIGGRVIIVDLELPPNTLREWLIRHHLATDRVVVLPLRGRGHLFANLLDPEERSAIASEIRDLDGEVLIVDPLSALLQAASLEENSNSDVGAMIRQGLVGVASESGISELVITHHMGVVERSRGATVINDAPDVLWKLVVDDSEDGDRARYFSAYGRNVDIPQGRLDFDLSTGRLTMPLDAPSRSLSRRQVQAQQTAAERQERITNALYAAGGVIDGRKALLTATKLNGQVITETLNELELTGAVTVESIRDGRQRFNRYRLTNGDAA